MAYPTKISSILWLFLWLTLPKHHQYCDYQILISLCSFLNQMAPENDEMKFQKLETCFMARFDYTGGFWNQRVMLL